MNVICAWIAFVFFTIGALYPAIRSGGPLNWECAGFAMITLAWLLRGWHP